MAGRLALKVTVFVPTVMEAVPLARFPVVVPIERWFAPFWPGHGHVSAWSRCADVMMSAMATRPAVKGVLKDARSLCFTFDSGFVSEP